MRVLIRMPNWLGDAVMATPAVNNLMRHFQGASFTLVCSPLGTQLFRDDPRFEAVIPDTSKQHRFRALHLTRLARRIHQQHGPFEYGFAFPYTLSGRWMLYASGTWRRAGRKWGISDVLLNESVPCDDTIHQVDIYNKIVNGALQTQYPTGPLTLHVPNPHPFPRPTIGINPGAAYGGAKRWLPERFAEVAAALSGRFDIVITGGPQESDTAEEIGTRLQEMGVHNWQNTVNNTSVHEMLRLLAGLDLLVTNDSGPMHMACALRVPIVAIFGPTDPLQNGPWAHDRLRIVRQDLECAPCHRRHCPLKHHACMRDVTSQQVIEAAWSVLEAPAVAAAG